MHSVCGLERKFYDESAPWKPHQPRDMSGFINKPHNKQGTDLQVVVRGKRYPAKVRVSKPYTWSNEYWLASKERICNVQMIVSIEPNCPQFTKARVVQRQVGWCSKLWKVETLISSKHSFLWFRRRGSEDALRAHQILQTLSPFGCRFSSCAADSFLGFSATFGCPFGLPRWFSADSQIILDLEDSPMAGKHIVPNSWKLRSPFGRWLRDSSIQILQSFSNL